MNSSNIITRLFSIWLVLGVAHAADPTGKWKAEFDTQIGKQTYTYDLKVDGEKFTGKATGEVNGDQHTVELKDGKLKGGRNQLC